MLLHAHLGRFFNHATSPPKYRLDHSVPIARRHRRTLGQEREQHGAREARGPSGMRSSPTPISREATSTGRGPVDLYQSDQGHQVDHYPSLSTSINDANKRSLTTYHLRTRIRPHSIHCAVVAYTARAYLNDLHPEKLVGREDFSENPP